MSKPERKDIEGPKHPSQEPIITQQITQAGGLGGNAEAAPQEPEKAEEGKE